MVLGYSSQSHIAEPLPGVQSIWKFEVWRWLMFIAGTVPLYGISRLSIHLLVTGLESHVPHIAKSALYYVVGIRVS